MGNVRGDHIAGGPRRIVGQPAVQFRPGSAQGAGGPEASRKHFPAAVIVFTGYSTNSSTAPLELSLRTMLSRRGAGAAVGRRPGCAALFSLCAFRRTLGISLPQHQPIQRA